MTVLCAGQTHVYRANSPRCDCGAQANNPPVGYGYPPGYTPNPHHPRYVPPPAEPEIPASVKAKAVEAGATHISDDGKKAFSLRMGQWCEAFWDSEERKFGSWYSCPEGLPEGVIEL